mgnify:FL=1
MAEKVKQVWSKQSPAKLRTLYATAQTNVAAQLTGSEKLSGDWGFINQGRSGVELRSGPRKRYGKSISLKDMIKILSLPRGESVVDDLSLMTKALRGRAGDPSGLVLYHMGEFVDKNIAGGKKILVENRYKGQGRGLRLTPVWEELVTELQKGLNKLNVAVHPVTGKPIKISQVVPKYGIGAGAVKEIPLYEFLGLTSQYENTKTNLDLLIRPENSHLPDKHPNGELLTSAEKRTQKAVFAKNTKFHYETLDPKTKKLRPRVDYFRDLSKQSKRYGFERVGTQAGKFAGIEQAERIAAKAAKATKQVRLPAGIEKLGLLEGMDEFSKYIEEKPSMMTEGKGKAKRIIGVRGADNPIVTSATPESQLTGKAGGGRSIVGVTRPAGTVSAAVNVDLPGPTSKQLDILKKLGVVNTDVILTRREASRLINQLKEGEFEASRTGKYPLRGKKKGQFQVRETPIKGKVDAKGKVTLSRLVRNRVVLNLKKVGLTTYENPELRKYLEHYGAQYNRKTKIWTIGNAMLKDHPTFWAQFGAIPGKFKERAVEVGATDRIVRAADPVPKQVQVLHGGVSRASSLSEAKGAATSIDDPYSWRMIDKDPRLYGTTTEVSTGERLGTSKPTTIRIHPANVLPETPIVEETVSTPKQKIKAKRGRIDTIGGWFRNKLQFSIPQEDKGLSQIERMAADSRERTRYFKALAEKRATGTSPVTLKGLFQSEKLFDDALSKVRGKSLKMLLPALLLAGVFGTIMGNERNAA